MRILLDMDEVLTSLVEKINEFYNERYGTHFTREDYYTCEWWHVWQCPYELASAINHEFITSPRHATIPPIPGSVDGVHALHAAGHELIIATSREHQYEQLTRAWLHATYGNAFTAIHLLNYYGGGKRKKSDVGKEIGADIAIEDQIKHAADITSAGIPCLLLDSPWNRQEPLPPLTTPVKTWTAILQEIEQRTQTH